MVVSIVGKEKKVSGFDELALKSRYISIVLYPDNPYHMEYLHFLEDTQTGFYIIHDTGDDLANVPLYGVNIEKKECYAKKHIHCMLCFKNARSGYGYLKSLPIVRYYQYAEQKQLFTVYDVPYTGIPDKANDGSIVEINKPLLDKCKPITDIYAHCLYYLHRDYKSYAEGKKLYNVNDIKMLNSDRSFLDRFYHVDDDMSDGQILDLIEQIWTCSNHDLTIFRQLLSMHSNPLLLKYVQSHAYFIKQFLIDVKREVYQYD